MEAAHGMDQAAGLRRLLGIQSSLVAHVVAFVAGDEAAGGTVLLTHTAAALADGGARVLLIDERPGSGGVHAALGIAPRGDLLDVLMADDARDVVAQAAAPGLSVLAAARLAADRRSADPELAQRLKTSLQRLRERYDFILINAAVARAPTFSPLALAAPHLAMVVAARGAAITRTYALIKQLAQLRGGDGFHVIVTRAFTEQAALAVFRNLAATATTHLAVTLNYLGGVHAPVTGHFAQALRGHLEVSSRAIAAGHPPREPVATLDDARGHGA
jgi:MinD-like ATPase involved in chromosome partitioning or flagellar assembly